MRLVRLTVDDFKCVQHAELEFCPGLNILFGENDIGKSTLAHAVRAGLLLPHSSSTRSSLRSWAGGEPSVKLTFATDTNKFWRVSRNYGDPGASELRFSKDDTAYSSEATARKVDGQLRTLLRWGIKPPGGKGGSRGLPESFLSHALLGEQVGAAQLLGLSLVKDADDTARVQLGLALEALAQDPVFKQVLSAAQTKVNEAYTPGGSKKKGKNSPFLQITEKINGLAQQIAVLELQEEETERARERLQALTSELTLARATSEEAAALVTVVRARLDQTKAVLDAEGRLAVAAAKVSKIEQAVAGLATDAAAIAELDRALQAARANDKACAASISAAETALHEATSALQRAKSQSSHQQHALNKAKVERRLAQCEHRIEKLNSTLKSAQAARECETQLTRARERTSVLHDSVATVQAEQRALVAREREANENLETHRGLCQLARLREARKSLEDARSAAQKRAALLARARQSQAEAENLRDQIKPATCPTADEVTALTTLRNELDVALAKVGVGLTVAVRPMTDLTLHVAIDGGPQQAVADTSAPIDASRTIALILENVAELTVSAGSPEDHKLAAALQDRWEHEGVPTLARTGAADLAALGEVLRQFQAREQQLRQHEAEAANSLHDAAAHAETASAVERLSAKVAEREARMGDETLPKLDREAASKPGGWEDTIEADTAAADTTLREAQKALASSREKEAQLAASLEAAERTQAAAATALQASAEGLDAEPREAASRIEAQLQQANTDRAGARQELDSLAEAGLAEVAAAHKAVEQATTVLKQERDAAIVAATLTKNAGEALVAARSRLDVETGHVEAMGIDAARHAACELAEALAKLPRPESPATDAELEATTASHVEADRLADRLRGDVRTAEGAFEQVGGEVTRDTLTSHREARDQARIREHEIELDYEAYRLLATTLRDVENEDGAHIGQALGSQVGERFKSLTQDRYDSIRLNAHLATDAVQVAGVARSFADLSAGTQDQLATILRLCIAEQLGSMLILDDHLAQTHRSRAAWFHKMLRRSADKIQIVVLTARPEDYLDLDELPQGKAPADFAGGSVRAINLDHVIERAASGATEV